MPLQTTALDAAVDGATAILAFASLHGSDPGSNGANEVTGGGYARQAVTWDPSSGGVAATDGPLSFTGPANDPVTHVGLWTQASGGTFLGGEALTGDQSFNAQGQYEVTQITVTATSS